MVEKYRFGNPINTDAVIAEVTEGSLKGDYLAFWKVYINKEKEEIIISYAMEEQDRIYGLGETTRGINKRGYIYRSMCADDAVHTEEKTSLYGAHNFLVVSGKETGGIFIDCPGEVVFDVGFSRFDMLNIHIKSLDVDIYTIKGDGVLSIVKSFREIIGRSYIPPRWGMGFGQSRWSYPDKEKIREVALKYREHNIPLDTIYLDIDYMEHYKDFTISEERFPMMKEFVQEMRGLGIRLVPIIDAGVKIEKGYNVYDEGVKEGFFCKDEEGKDFIAAVWPGKVHFPDFLNKAAREWFGMHYKMLIELGFEGFWNDMNEPAIFYTQERLQEVLQKLKKQTNTDMDLDEFFGFKDLVTTLSNNEEDYKCFFHNIDGKMIRHDKVHNIYGYYMTRAASEAFGKIVPDKRILLFSRASYVGMHRYGGIWTGDNQSWWSHILLSMQQMVGLNMCGFLFAGSDIGGFGSNATEELVMRFTQWGIFTPLMRNHSAIGTVYQEAYAFSRTDKFADIIDLRYFFLPYLYSEYMRATLKNEMYFLPLAFLYPEDEMACRVEDQLFVGKGMMIAPVYVQNALGRYVYLPENMKMYRFRSRFDYDVKMYEKGHHYVECNINEVLVFITSGTIIPCAYKKEGQYIRNTDAVCMNELVLLANENNDVIAYDLYMDDGNTAVDNNENYVNIAIYNHVSSVRTQGSLYVDDREIKVFDIL